MRPDPHDLTQVERSRRAYQHNTRYGFTEGPVREAFQHIYSPDESYVLFQTIANKQAAQALTKYHKKSGSTDPPWQTVRLRANEHPDPDDDDAPLRFRNDLRDTLEKGIDRVAFARIGKRSFAHYPLVANRGVHTMDRDPLAIYWPTIYIVTEGREAKLKEIIDTICEDEGFETLKKIETPHFYRMPEIGTLHTLGIAPFVRPGKEMRATANDLAMSVDFLAQMTQTCEWTDPSIND
ncbi:MAG: hypothetical protein ABIH41_02645 [Nanoarchaeota archaeon]